MTTSAPRSPRSFAAYDAAGVKDFDFPQTSAPVDPEVDPVSSLLSEWGQRSPENDFNGDGVVDMQDLLILLAKMGVKHKIKPFIIAPVDHTDGLNEITPVDELIAEWGHECPESDFNGDGVVDMQDLLILLKDMGFKHKIRVSIAKAAVKFAAGKANALKAFDDGQTDISPVYFLISEWGYECPENDFNGDGVVDMQDLLILLENMGASAPVSSSS